MTHDLSRAQFRKSTRSSGDISNCVEVAGIPGHVAVRDSKRPDAGTLVVSAALWQRIASDLKAG